tara:strand:- start:159 stop:404 length:246 start_codon:yes stop_codon:yes gene_type:complete
MTKIHIVDTVEVTLDSYDVEEFCKLWNRGNIVDTHRNHYQYKIYSDIKKARSLLNLFNEPKLSPEGYHNPYEYINADGEVE